MRVKSPGIPTEVVSQDDGSIIFDSDGMKISISEWGACDQLGRLTSEQAKSFIETISEDPSISPSSIRVAILSVTPEHFSVFDSLKKMQWITLALVAKAASGDSTEVYTLNESHFKAVQTFRGPAESIIEVFRERAEDDCEAYFVTFRSESGALDRSKLDFLITNIEFIDN